jgi:hypothetical protein
VLHRFPTHSPVVSDSAFLVSNSGFPTRRLVSNSEFPTRSLTGWPWPRGAKAEMGK